MVTEAEAERFESLILTCDHCEAVAIYSAAGLFGEYDAEHCMSCGMPGSPFVCEDEDGNEYVEWQSVDEPNMNGTWPVCNNPDCIECR